jgi:hypothetical protein
MSNEISKERLEKLAAQETMREQAQMARELLALRMNKPSAETYGWIAEYPTIPAGIGGITYSFHDNRVDAQEEADAYNGHVVEVVRR